MMEGRVTDYSVNLTIPKLGDDQKNSEEVQSICFLPSKDAKYGNK